MVDLRRKEPNPARLFSSVIGHAPDAILVFNLALQLVWVNEQSCHLLERSEVELLNRNLNDLDIEVFPTPANQLKQQLLRDGKLVAETWLKLAGKKRRALEINVSLINLSTEQHILVFARDISERKRTEQDLEELSILIKALMEHIPDSIFFKDVDGRWLRVSRNVLNLVGASSMEEVRGKTDFDFYSQKFAAKTRADDLEVIKSGQPLIGDIEHRELENGTTHWTIVTKVPLRDKNGAIIGIAGIAREINEIIEQEERLRIRENQLSIAGQIAAIGYWEYNKERDLFTLNDNFYKVYGRTAAEYGGYQLSTEMFINRFAHPDDVEKMLRELSFEAPASAGNSQKVLEHRFLLPDGSIGYVAVSFIIKRDEQGRTVGAYGVCQNITERKQAEIAIREREAKLSAAASIAKLGYWEYDIKGQFFDLSEQFYTVFRTSPDTLGGYRVSLEDYAVHFLLPEERAHIFSKIGDAVMQMKKNESNSAEHRILYGDGEIGHVFVRYFCRFDESGQVSRVVGVNQDITDLKIAKEALHQSEINLQKAFEVAEMGSFRYHIEADWIEWSPMALKVYACTPEQMPINLEEYLGIIVAEDVEMVREAVNSCNWEKVLNGEYRVVINGKEMWIRGQADWQYDETGKPIDVIGIVQNVTDAKNAQCELAGHREQLEQLVQKRTAQLEQVNKDLEDFAYSISHDLRAPLRHINGFARLLKKKLPDLSPVGSEYIELIQQASMRMGEMIDGLLNFSRLGRRQLKTTMIDLNDLVKEVIDHFAPDQLQRNIKWILHSLPSVEGDPTLLKVVFENLVSNAIKYTKNEPQAIIEINTYEGDPNRRTIYIKDNGVGFDMAYSQKLFGVFQRLHRQEDFEGSGIGLANALQIIRKHGGDMCAEGEVGVGATFFLSFTGSALNVK